ncbi:unnamed protein product [Gordionus sp. m RMFG-2023]
MFSTLKQLLNFSYGSIHIRKIFVSDLSTYGFYNNIQKSNILSSNFAANLIFKRWNIRVDKRYRPNIVKTIRKHGFRARLATKGGRDILRRRILKGRFVLSH